MNANIAVKLIRIAPRDPCKPLVEWDEAMIYGGTNAKDIHDKIAQAIGEQCEEARRELAPAVHVHAEVFDSTGRSYGSSFLTPNVPAEFKQGSIKLMLDNDNHLTTLATPVCDSSPLPIS